MHQKVTITIFIISSILYFLESRAYCAFPPLTDTLLNNTTYYYDDRHGVVVKDGEYKEYRLDPGVGKHLICGIYVKKIVHGDLNADGNEDAGVLYTYSGGGSGQFKMLAAIINDRGRPKNVDAVCIDDRAIVEQFYYKNNSLVIQAIVHGKNDPGGGPTERKLIKFTLKNNKLMKKITSLGKVNFDKERQLNNPNPLKRSILNK